MHTGRKSALIPIYAFVSLAVIAALALQAQHRGVSSLQSPVAGAITADARPATGDSGSAKKMSNIYFTSYAVCEFLSS
jgi:hypothetical protein